MAKLKNFTLEGDRYVLVAHLNMDGKPVFDLDTKRSKETLMLDGNSIVSGIPIKDATKTAYAIKDDIYSLFNSYESSALIERFLEDWGEPEESEDV